jgi:hypothetical protein
MNLKPKLQAYQKTILFQCKICINNSFTELKKAILQDLRGHL